MLMEVYLFLFAMGFVLAGLSFYTKLAQREIILIPFLAAAMFFFSAMGAFAIEKPFCGQAYNTTSDWSCHDYVKTDPGLGYLGAGLGLIMLIFAIYTAVTTAGEYAVTGAAPK